MKPMKPWQTIGRDMVALGSLAAICYGVWAIWPPLFWIVAGFAGCAIVWLTRPKGMKCDG